MQRWFPLMALTATLIGGCIIYESNGADGDCWSCEEDFWGGEDVDTGVDPGPSFTLFVSPDSGEIGTSLLATITFQGEFDMLSVESVDFGPDIDVLATIVRQEDTLLVLDIRPDSQLGPVDVVVDRFGGDSVVIDGAFEIIDVAGSEEDTGGCN